ncbi:MAG TPA: hypothetical protein VFL59_04790 [Candidatus Nanopelagicales bacterium]|nr:hypothetical protein [Candidatus Nanopelagicales bacterium]
MLPQDVVLRTVSREDVDVALADIALVDVEWQGRPAWALSDVAESEELLADGLAALAAENRLAVVAGPDPAGRRLALARATGTGVPTVVLDDAHRVGLDETLGAVEDLPEDAVLVLSLDNALPLAHGVMGAVALDVAASGICPVLVGDSERDDRALGVQRAAVAAGRWVATPPDDRSLVVVPTASPDEALVRVGQLVTTSIPRAFGHGTDQVAVVVVEPSGPVGVEPLRAGLAETGVQVLALAELGDRMLPATVLVLPGAATSNLTRATVYAGLRSGRDHVSVVHGFGSDAAGLAELVGTTTDRPRRTRLAALLHA